MHCSKSNQLWDRFLQNTKRDMPGKQQFPDTLNEGTEWTFQQDDLTHYEVELCRGPERPVWVSDRALVGDAAIACMQVEGANFARDSVVLAQNRW